ncbi:MAG: TraB/GumN family protein [Candidatus Diapherotrites archaeon]
MQAEKLKIGEKEVFLVGTAHVSSESVELVRKTIEKEKPDAVGVELDLERLNQLKSGEKWRETNIVDIVKHGKTYLFLINLLLSNYQRKIGRDLGVMPGAEMLEAVKAAEEKGIPIELLDRSVKVSLKRALNAMGLIEKAKLFFSLFIGLFESEKIELTEEKLKELKDKDVLNELLAELSKEFPAMKKVLVDERDAFIAQKIRESRGKKVVAVVGAGHVEGIKKLMQKESDLNELQKMPIEKNYLAAVGWLIPVLFIALFGYAFFTKGIETSLIVLLSWAAITGILAAIGTALAGGHIYSILTSLVAAPITTLHPLLAVGWFAGYVEARVRVPKVKDFESLHAIESLGDLYKNQVTRILMVTALANLGATIGTLIAFPYIAGLVL